MSKKILGIGLVIAGVALQFIPGIGQAIGLPLIAAGISSSSVIALGLIVAGSLLMGPATPKALNTDATSRLTATLNPTEPRKIAFGETALAADVRYQAYTGANQEYLEQIVCVASHKVEAITEFWLGSDKAWDSTSGVASKFAGYLTVSTVLEGTRTNGIAIDSVWTSDCTLTGCAYVHFKFKLTGNSSKASSPFSSGVTSRYTIRGKGALTYDPRLDSTVTGGSGSQRADDQTTWAWDGSGSRNPALQELWYELGWRISGKLAVGKGLPVARIDLASYAVAANVCDETILLAGGGSEPRYRSDGILSEGDDPTAVRDNLCATMNAILRDAGGKLALNVIHNDLGTPVTPSGRSAFDERDISADIGWDQTPDLSATFNIVRGRQPDPSDNALYQLVDVPEASLDSPDGIDRIDTFDLPLVESSGQAQRLFKQRLQRNQYQGQLSFTGGPAWWGISLGDVFALSHSSYGWNGKLFRCTGQKLGRDGTAEIVAVEENAAIYAWDAEESPAVTVTAPTIYDEANHPIIRAIGDTVLQFIKSSGTSGLTFSVDSSGNFTISNHFRIYTDIATPVAVTGGTVATGGTSGQYALIFYDDPDRLGGAVSYQHLVINAGGDDSSAYASADNPGRHFVAIAVIPASGSSSGGGAPGSGGGAVGGGGNSYTQIP